MKSFHPKNQFAPRKGGVRMRPRRLAGLFLAVVAVALLSLSQLAGGTAHAQTPTVDYDTDDDNLIEVSNLAQLNAMRWDLDGNGVPTGGNYAAAFPNRAPDADGAPTMGCPNDICEGYELTADLDFDTNRNGAFDLGDSYSNGGAGWEPIRGFTATFDGNYHTISNLYIERAGREIGLFGRIDTGAVIRKVGLPNVEIAEGGNNTGAVVGRTASGGLIDRVWATGSVKALPNTDRDFFGGLVGRLNGGTLQASWANVYVKGQGQLGGLVGSAESGSSITTSYSLGTVISRGEHDPGGSSVSAIQDRTDDAGGVYGRLIGRSSSNSSYFDRNVVHVSMYYSHPEFGGQERSRGYASTAKSTAEMQEPVGYTGIYANWNLDLDNADGDNDLNTGGDDPWDFGTASQYPVLKGFGGQGRVDRQGRVDLPDVTVTSAQAVVTEGETVRFTVNIDAAPAEPLTIDVLVQARGDYGVVANAATTVTIPANHRSVAYTVTTVGDAEDERNGWVQLSALTGTAYDLPVPAARVNINDNDAPASVAGVYTPRLPEASGSLDAATTRTSQRVSRPGSFSLHVRPDDSRQARDERADFGETQAYLDYHASLIYKWEQISGPPLGPPLLGGCEKNLPGHPGGASTYCTYPLPSIDQALSFNVWDGVTEPSSIYPYRVNRANPPGDYVFRLLVRDQFEDDTYTAPQTITVTVADETGGASAPRAAARVTTSSLHPQAAYSVTEVGKGLDGVYGGGDDPRDRGRGDPGPDEIIGTDDDNVLVVGPDGQPCTDDDTLACGEDGRPGTDDDKLNLGPDGRAGTADDNTYVVEPPGNALQTPERRVTLSGSGSRAARGSIRSYSWQQICMNPDADGDHKLIAREILLRGYGYCGVDVELSSTDRSSTQFITPALPAQVRRVVPASNDCFGAEDPFACADAAPKTETVTKEEATVQLFFMLTVTDSEGNRDFDIVRVEVEKAPEVFQDVSPIARATASYAGGTGSPRPPALEGARVTLDGSRSRARRGRIASYQWSQMSGPDVELTNADQRRATFTTPTHQTRDMAYAFLLRVKDTGGSSDSAVVRIGVRARPTAAVEFTTSNAQARTWSAGDVIAMRGTLGGYEGEMLAYHWSFTSIPPATGPGHDLWSVLEDTATGPREQVTTNFTLPCLAAETTFTFKFTVFDSISPDVVAQRTLTVNANAETCPTSSTSPPPRQQQLESAGPAADAGPDVDGKRGQADIVLAGSGTPFAGGSPELGYQWRIAGASHIELETLTAFLADAGQAQARFTMPRRGNMNDRSALDDGNWIDFELTVTDGDGVSASDTMRLTIQGTTWNANTGPANAPPTVAELAAARVFAGATVTLTGSASDAEDATDALTYRWEQTGGTPTVPINGAGSATASITAPAVTEQTELTIRLSVTDSGGLTASREATVTVLPLPTACAGDDLAGAPGESVTLQGTCSANPYGAWHRLTHQWTQLSGPTVTLTHPNTSQPAVNFGDPRFTVPTNAADGAVLEFQLTVTDQEGGTDADTVTVTVQRPNAPPTVAELSPARVFAGETVTLTGSASDAEDGAGSLTYAWEQTGGTPTVSLDGANAATASFTAPDVAGITAFTIRLSVTDSGGLTASREATVTILPLPTACAGPDLSGAPGSEVILQGKCSHNPYGKWWHLEHQWTQLSGPTVTLTHPQTERHNQGADKFGDPRFVIPDDAATGTTLEFQLTVTDQEGGTDTDTVTVTVTAASSGG